MKIIRHLQPILIYLLAFSYAVSIQAYEDDLSCIQLEKKCEEARALSQYDQMKHYSTQLLKKAEKQEDLRTMAYANFYAGLSELFLGHAERATKLLDLAESKAQKVRQDSVLALVMNTRAIYYAAVENNNFLAQEYFFKSLELANKAEHLDLKYRIQGNLLTLTHATGGSIPLSQAQEVYDYGMANKNAEQLSMGAYYLAYYYYEHEEYEETERYLHIAFEAFKDFPTEDIAAVYCLAAKMYLSTEKVEMAGKMVDKAISLAKKYNQSSIVVDANITYAELLHHKHKYQESIDLLKSTLEMIDDTGLNSKYVVCNQLMSSNMLATGNTREAYEYLRCANDVLKNQVTINMERLHYEQQILTDMEQKRLEAKHKEEQLIQQRRTTTILIIAIAILVVFLTSIIASYRHRHLLYRKIVRQNTHAIARQEMLEKQIEALSNDLKLADKNNNSVQKQEKDSFIIGDDRMESLYTQLCYLMNTERLYTQPQLTREKMAERLGTNRTYLTAIIKEKAGMNYLQFVNSYRINEAIRILSDKEKMDYPLKRIWSDLGFSSPTTFFKLFQQTVGITPTTYRKQFIEDNNMSKETEDQET